MNSQDVTCPFKTVPEILSKRNEEMPDKIYLYFGDKHWTYKEFHEQTNQSADSFKKLGLKKGSHIGILIPNSPEFLFAWFGIMKAGFVGVTLNTLLKADELEYIINDSDAEILVTTPQYRKMLDPSWKFLKNIKHVILTGNDIPKDYPDSILLNDFIAKGDKHFSTDIFPEDHASMIYTSGTTGHPKGVVLTHSNIMYNSYIAPRYIDLQKNDIALCIMPLFHVNAQIASIMATMQSAASVVLEEMFKPRTFIQTLKKFQCTTFSGVPTIYNYLNEMKEAEGEDLSFLKACVCGAAPMPVEVFHTFEKKFKTKIIEGYGLSEGTCVSSLNPIHGERKIGSIGLPIDGQEMSIWDNNNQALPDGDVGEIMIKGPNMMVGYYKREDENAKTFVDGWLRTGDLGYRDRDGYYFIVARKKEMIITGGENIYPKEIEEVLYKNEDISECAIVGIPDKTYGEVVGAFIIPKAGSTLTEKDIKTYLRPKIAGYKFPRIIEIVTELPKTSTGKIQKNKIVEEYAGNLKLINKINGHVSIKYHWVYGDALAKFYNGLKTEGVIYGIKCPKCHKVQCPPKSFCGMCYVECTEWVKLPNVGTLETFTTVYMEFPGQPKKPPYTYGYIKIDGSHTHIYHLIADIPEADIKIGMRVEPVWEDIALRKGTLYDIKYFRPLHIVT
jgi:long-chain acyl-CoA synthetase